MESLVARDKAQARKKGMFAAAAWGGTVLLGYAGWAPMQAENEIAAGAWVPMPAASDLVFDVPLDKRWAEAVRRLGLDPGEVLVGGGGAQA